MIRVKKFGAERRYATYVDWESGFGGVLNKTYFKETGKITKMNMHGWVCFESIAGRSLRPQISRETRNAKHTVLSFQWERWKPCSSIQKAENWKWLAWWSDYLLGQAILLWNIILRRVIFVYAGEHLF